MIIRSRLINWFAWRSSIITYQKKIINNKTKFVHNMNFFLNQKILYSFVNVPIQSKYYHIQLPDKVNQILHLIQSQSNFNEKTVLLQHLTDIVTNDSRIILSRDHIAKINQQFSLWKGRKGRFDKIATIAWVINRLKLQKYNKDILAQIADRFENDQWYVNFDQSLKALQAFAHHQNQELKDYIFPRIQRNLQITVWEFNMKIYKRMVVGLLQGGRMQSPLWDKLQQYIMKNLGMEYQLKTLTDIFTCYALAQKGSDQFFQMIQKAIYLGHWYNYQLKHKILPGYNQTGQFYSLLVQTYSTVKQNSNIFLLPNFLEYIYSGVADRRTNYQHLSSFTKLISHLPGIFQKQDEEQILTNLLQNKKPTSINYNQIIEFYNIIKQKQIILPIQLHTHIEKVLISDIRKKLIPPSKVLQICEQLLEKDYILDPNILWEAVDQSITSTFKYLQGEQAKAVMELSYTSKFIPQKTKKHLTLPGKILPKS